MLENTGPSTSAAKWLVRTAFRESLATLPFTPRLTFTSYGGDIKCKPVPRWKVKYIDPKMYPWATFKFLYRSRGESLL